MAEELLEKDCSSFHYSYITHRYAVENGKKICRDVYIMVGVVHGNASKGAARKISAEN